MQPLAYAAILAVIAPLTVMTWLAFTGDRAGLRNIQANLGMTSKAKGTALSINEKLRLASQRIRPKGYTGWLYKQLAGAGRPKEWPLARLIMVKPLLGFAGAASG